MSFRPAVLVAITTIAALTVATSCGTKADDLYEGKVEIDRTTTTTDRPCDVPEAAERAITEASLTATRADDAARQATNDQLTALEETLPPSLVGNVDVLRDAFETAWASTDDEATETDPFDTTEYLVADQEIRRYVEGNCRTPSR